MATEEEMFAVILAKLEELEKKVDDTNRNMGKTNALLCSCAEPSTPSSPSLEEEVCVPTSASKPATSSSATSTSSPPQDAALVVSIAATELVSVAPTRCSTVGRYEATHFLVSGTTSSASPTASPASSPARDAAHVVPIMATEHQVMAPARCSIPGLYQAARVQVSATTSSAPPSPPSTSAPSQDVACITPFASSKPGMAMLIGCSTSGPSSDVRVPAPAFTSTAATLLLDINEGSKFNFTGSYVEQIVDHVPHQVPVDLKKLCNIFNIGLCNSHKLLEVMPHDPYAFSLNDGNNKAHAPTTEHAHLNECLEMHQPWSRPTLAHGPDAFAVVDGKLKEIVQHCFFEMDESLGNLSDINNVNCGKGIMMQKLLWLLCSEVSNTWFERMLLINGSLLEISPWCSGCVVFEQLKAYWRPPLQLNVVSKGADLRTMSWQFLFFFYFEPEARRPKLLLLPTFPTCSPVMPLVHSGARMFTQRSGRRIVQHIVHIRYLLKKLNSGCCAIFNWKGSGVHVSFLDPLGLFQQKHKERQNLLEVLSAQLLKRSIPWWHLGSSMHHHKVFHVIYGEYKERSLLSLNGCHGQATSDVDVLNMSTWDPGGTKVFGLGDFASYIPIIQNWATSGDFVCGTSNSWITVLTEESPMTWDTADGATIVNSTTFMQNAVHSSGVKQLKWVTIACLNSDVSKCKVAQFQLETASSQIFLSNLMNNKVALQAAAFQRVLQIHECVPWRALVQVTKLVSISNHWHVLPMSREKGFYLMACYQNYLIWMLSIFWLTDYLHLDVDDQELCKMASQLVTFYMKWLLCFPVDGPWCEKISLMDGLLLEVTPWVFYELVTQDHKWMHSVCHMHDHLLLWELDDSKESAQTVTLLMHLIECRNMECLKLTEDCHAVCKIEWLQLPWDPGGFSKIGLGTSRIFRGEECQEPDRAWKSSTGWAWPITALQQGVYKSSEREQEEASNYRKKNRATGGGERKLEG